MFNESVMPYLDLKNDKIVDKDKDSSTQIEVEFETNNDGLETQPQVVQVPKH